MREEWEPEYDWYDAFRVSIMGGRWTKIHKNVAGDGCKAFARCHASKSWCRLYNWPTEKSYMFRKYGVDGAMQLGTEFARISNHWYNVHLMSGVDLYNYVATDAPEDSLEFVTWMTTLDPVSHCFTAGMALRAMRPALSPNA